MIALIGLSYVMFNILSFNYFYLLKYLEEDKNRKDRNIKHTHIILTRIT